MLNGHSHNYQRWAPQDPSGHRDRERGIREFVVGTGGASHYAIAGGDETVSTAWMRSENLALGGTPLTLIQSIPGLVHVLGYLDARRSLA